MAGSAHTDVAAYVLGVLSEAENTQFEAHLMNCPHCQLDLIELYQLPDVLDLVKRSDSALIWRSARQAPVARNQLSFEVRDPGALEAGNYDLVVRGHAPDHEEVVARYWLRIGAQ